MPIRNGYEASPTAPYTLGGMVDLRLVIVDTLDHEVPFDE
jgi:hypothetical protein